MPEKEYQLNTSNPNRSAYTKDSCESVWYKVPSSKVSIGVMETKETEKPIFVCIQKEEPESGERTNIWLNQIQWANLFKLSPDINADVNRI